MFVLLQPLFTLIVGAALAVFGCFHTYQLLPNPLVWRHVIDVSPHLLAVLVFGSCMLITLAGLALFWHGARGTRTRLTQLRRLRWPGASAGGHYVDGPVAYDDQRW
jgi:lysylphosphatidylglycerol synthetase-like protein (DUF2156 family)